MPQTASSAFRPVADLLARASLAPRQSHKLLTIWPLVRTDAPVAPPYVSLATARGRDALAIEELKTGPTVPHVQVTNRGGVAVLLLFGEELRGALQNRIANASYLVPPHGEVTIDVSCVEQGRWSRRESARFRARGEVVSSAIRHKMAMKVASARHAGRHFDADQGEVWSEVRERVAYSRAASPTGAYADYVGTRHRDLDEAAAAFAPVPGQVGFVAAIGDEVIGLEAIGRPEVFAASFQGLLRAYLVDAIDASALRDRRTDVSAHAPRPARFDAPEAFLSALAAAPAESGPSLGLGTDARIAGGMVCGCALVLDEVIHLTAFPSQPERRGRVGVTYFDEPGSDFA